jgi:CRP/FNR family transcriptional regulator, anaerobic regulatory protein
MHESSAVDLQMKQPTLPGSPSDRLEVSCSHCSLRALCLPGSFCAPDIEGLDSLVSGHRQLRRGEALLQNGSPFAAIHAVRSGSFKCCVKTRSGREQITGFQMAGDLLGFDGLGEDVHRCDAIALEDSEVCIIPYAALEQMSRQSAALQRQLHRAMSREIVRAHDAMLLLGGLCASERVAAFLSNLSLRQQARGFSPSSLLLRMSRQEIGTYLGLKLETVSRCFSRLHEAGVLDVQTRHVRILQPAALQQVGAGLKD